MICILYGFPCEMDFSLHKSPNLARFACDEGGILRRVVRNPSHMENHTKYIFSHTLMHLNEVKYTVQSRISWKPCEMDLSHNCSLHGGKSEVCEKNYVLQKNMALLISYLDTTHLLFKSFMLTF